ncbi:MAG: P1 family peptidase [Clostridiales bacterium]|nr:P1 family peptidase [Clostridiales bacterium]
MKPRAREAGLKLSGITGKWNAITDVPGVEVGYSTVIIGEPKDYKKPGSDFARTGVTAILPRGHQRTAVFAGRADLNGNGELTGTHWIDDSGFMHGPLMITNTNSVGIVRDTTSRWMIENGYYYPLIVDGRPIEGSGYFYPAVGETWDGIMNDTNGFHINAEHVLEALGNAGTGPIEEGNVGGGTGMQCHQFKGGTGTSSRILPKEAGGYTVGALVQANHGFRPHFQMFGIDMYDEIKNCDPIINTFEPKPGTGSIVVVIATDAPVLPWQLTKMCRRIPMGIGRLGGCYENGSGDIFLAFSTANENAYTTTKSTIELLGDDMLDPIFKAVADVTEEAILNVLFAAETMVGKEQNTLYALPQDQVLEILGKHGKLRK